MRPPEHDRAIDVRGTIAATLRLTRRAALTTVLLLASLGVMTAAYLASAPAAARVYPAIIGVIILLSTAPRTLATIRAWQYVLRRRWEFYQGSTYVTESTARIDLRAAQGGEVRYFAAISGKHQRELLATPMFGHVWFVGDIDGAGRGVIVPAGGGVMIPVRRLAVLTSSVAGRRMKFVRFGKSPEHMRRLQERYDRRQREAQERYDRRQREAQERSKRRARKIADRQARRQAKQSTEPRAATARPAKPRKSSTRRSAPTRTRSLPTQLLRGRRQKMSRFLPLSGPDDH